MTTLSPLTKAERIKALSNIGPIGVSLAFFIIVILLRSIDLFVLKLDELPDALIVSKILGFLLVLGFLWSLRKPIRSIGLHAKNFDKAFLIGGLSLVGIYVVLYGIQFYRLIASGETPRLVMGVMDPESGVTGNLFMTLFFLVGQIANAFMEESIFRGVMLPHLMRRFRFGISNLIQAILFGLAHLVFPLYSWVSGEATVAAALSYAANLMFATTFAGLVFGYLYYRTGSLWTPWLAHLIDNIVLLIFHIQTMSRINAQVDIAMPASIIGYLLLVTMAWIITKRSNLEFLKPWEAS